MYIILKFSFCRLDNLFGMREYDFKLYLFHPNDQIILVISNFLRACLTCNHLPSVFDCVCIYVHLCLVFYFHGFSKNVTSLKRFFFDTLNLNLHSHRPIKAINDSVWYELRLLRTINKLLGFLFQMQQLHLCFKVTLSLSPYIYS